MCRFLGKCCYFGITHKLLFYSKSNKSYGLVPFKNLFYLQFILFETQTGCFYFIYYNIRCKKRILQLIIFL